MIGLTHKARVEVDELGAVVKPGIILAQSRRVELTNATGDLIQVFVPTCGGHVVSIEKDGTKPIDLADANPGIHAFAVFSERVGDFARGGSSPKIIIQ